MTRRLVLLVALLLGAVLLDRGAGLVIDQVAARSVPVSGLRVHVTSLPTGPSALWQLVRGRFGEVEVDADRAVLDDAAAGGIRFDGRVQLRDVHPFARRVGSFDGSLTVPWSALSTYVRHADRVAELGSARLGPAPQGGIALMLTVPVLGADVPVRTVADVTLTDRSVVVRARGLDVAGVGLDRLPAGVRAGVLALLGRSWPLDLPPGLRVDAVRATRAGLRLQVSGREVQAEDLAAANWVPRETWDTVPHALAP